MGEKITNNGKIMKAITASTIRGIVTISRDLHIQKDDIVTLDKEGSQYILIYYGRED